VAVWATDSFDGSAGECTVTCAADEGGNVVPMWIPILSIAVVLCIAGVIVDWRRGKRDSLGEAPDEWRSERDAAGDTQRRANPPPSGF
jgi:hypothetical protein